MRLYFLSITNNRAITGFSKATDSTFYSTVKLTGSFSG